MVRYKFPQDFLWGVSSSSYQIEGSHDRDGRRPSIWDTFSHTPGKVQNGDTGDIACDHYNRYKEDVALLRTLGVKAYRFSIAWPRIFPDGKGSPNEKGMQFYRNLVDELIKNDIKPIVTLYHWDLPQALQDEGGWDNKSIIEHFKGYANYVFDNLGNGVHQWITMNEPWVSTFAGNLTGEHAPGLVDLSTALRIGHNMLLAHGETIKLYREKKLKGSIGITYNVSAISPKTDSCEDVHIAETANAYVNAWFMEPVLKGRYPELLDNIFKEYKIEIPWVRDSDMEIISTPIDFIGLNYYTRQIVKSGNGFFGAEILEPEGECTDMDWEVYPKGLYDILVKIKQDYGNMDIYITENGAAYTDGPDKYKKINDHERIEYLKEHIKSAYKAIKDGISLRGYYVWSFLDNFEWAYGYSKRFGIIYVNFHTQERIIKDSGKWYKQVIENNGLDQ